ncbi:hypothetical protein MPLDJ20_60573 [Mesorhizobium plurifarium]|uniref:Uncharacterized protein n=1 Tax=Mesorhizobium plurifarium TaxID=69974 RepID=A0A090GQK0_MESPL|nr:hypothetical protein MPLDJ20_60573 [Mesorhizobium plurifarium]
MPVRTSRPSMPRPPAFRPTPMWFSIAPRPVRSKRQTPPRPRPRARASASTSARGLCPACKHYRQNQRKRAALGRPFRLSVALRAAQAYFLRDFIPGTALALPGFAGPPGMEVLVIDTVSLAGKVSSRPSSSSSSSISWRCSCSSERTASVFLDDFGADLDGIGNLPR